MKKIYFVSLVFLLNLNTEAQHCRLTGLFKAAAGQKLKLLLLSSDGHYDVFSEDLAVSPGGRFDTTLRLGISRLALLKTKDWQQYLLLSPGRDLFVKIDTLNKTNVSFSGKAAPENRIVQNSVLSRRPFFMLDSYESNRYVKMNAADWRKYVLQPVENELAQFRQNTQSTPIPDSLKRLLQSEVAFIFQSYLRDFANNYLSWGKNPARDSLMDIVMKWQPMPDSVQLISGFYANMMLKNHAHYQVNKIARKIPGDTTSLQTRAGNFLGMPFSHIDSLIRKYGEEYFLAWLYASRHLPSSLQEKMLVNKVMNAVDNGDFEAAFALSDTLWNHFPESRYKGWVDNVIAGVHNRLKKQSSPGIHYRPPGTIRNLEDLVAPYKGKVIYIDIWGSWCGPCKAEMPYVPALKKKFEDKDVVFFYLDMDKPERIQTWKNYVTYIELIGEHYQMTSEEIEPIWKVVHEAGGNKDSYPGYLLIDRQGKLVHADAKRPSDGEALYQQIEALLK